MSPKSLKKSSVSWFIKAQTIGFLLKDSLNSLEWWSKTLNYRIDYLKEYQVLYKYLKDCPKLVLYSRREALYIIRTYKEPYDINAYIADLEINYETS